MFAPIEMHQSRPPFSSEVHAGILSTLCSTSFQERFFWQHWIIFENIHFWKYPKPWLLSLQEIEACSHNSFLSNLKLWQEFGPGHRSRCFNIFGVKTINLLNVEWEQIFLIPNNYVDLFWDFLVHCGCDIMLQSSFSQVSLEIYNKSVHLPNLLKPQQAFTMVKLLWWPALVCEPRLFLMLVVLSVLAATQYLQTMGIFKFFGCFPLFFFSKILFHENPLQLFLSRGGSPTISGVCQGRHHL